MDALRLLAIMRAQSDYAGQILTWRSEPMHLGRYASPETALPGETERSLEAQGITRLYVHQAAAVDAVAGGRHIVVVTPTSSGKSLCFHLPVLSGLGLDPASRALYIFPTKALARDQLGKIAALAPALPAGVYDADTPGHERRRLRSEARLILTNPDILHLGILPYHLNWAGFFAHLRYVVVDEVHTYRGVFGTHVGHVLRRLRRIARAHGSDPQFIAASATISNPAEHAAALVGAPVELIQGDDAPRGERTFVLWDAYRPGRQASRLARSPQLEDATRITALLLREGVRTIVFVRSRQAAEWLLIYLERHLEEMGRPELFGRIRTYRGGYLPSERREIERQLFAGELLGVISTSALELGVDIGGLEAAVMLGYPGTMASLWQQAGRAGRRGDPAFCVFIPGANLLERYLLQHPDYFFGRPFEQAIIDPANPYILAGHLAAAAFEWPLSGDDEPFWGELGFGLAGILAEEGMLTENPSERRWYYAGGGYPAERVGLRGSGAQYRLTVSGETIGTIDAAAVPTQAHPHAVYLHAGDTYQVASVDNQACLVVLERFNGGYFTEASETTSVAILETSESKEHSAFSAHMGEILVKNTITGYRRRNAVTGEVLGREPLDMPPVELRTIGFWMSFPGGLAAELAARSLDAAGGLHGLEHLLIGLLPLVVLCDRWDVAGTSTLFHAGTGGPAVFIYDAAVGGMGFAERAYACREELFERAAEVLEACGCANGCPSCIQSPKCGSFNQPLDKKATKEILHRMQN